MKKINLTRKRDRYSLNLNEIEKEFEFVENPLDADFILCQSSIPDTIIESMYKKVILLQIESPLTSHRIWTYENFDKFHTVLVHNPNGDNQFKFTDNPIVFPWNPTLKLHIDREDTTIKTRNVFFAGKKSDNYAKVPDRFGCSTLYDVRDKLVQSLSKYPNFKMYGIGWDCCIEGKSTRAIYNEKLSWIPKKLEDINDSESEFVICMENTIQPGLIADKIHDGFNSDRVVMYFGEQNIEKYVPENCFINLKSCFDYDKKELNGDKIMEIVNNITQEEYDSIINNAREWRKTLVNKYEKEKDKLTKFIIERMNGN